MNKDIGKRIKEARLTSGLTQRELAEKCGLAVGTIQQYELEKRTPRLEMITKISEALEIPYITLIGWDEEMTQNMEKAIIEYDYFPSSEQLLRYMFNNSDGFEIDDNEDIEDYIKICLDVLRDFIIQNPEHIPLINSCMHVPKSDIAFVKDVIDRIISEH